MTKLIICAVIFLTGMWLGYNKGRNDTLDDWQRNRDFY